MARSWHSCSICASTTGRTDFAYSVAIWGGTGIPFCCETWAMSRKATACVTLTMSFSSSATGVGLRLTSISPLEKNSSIHASAVWTLCSESGK